MQLVKQTVDMGIFRQQHHPIGIPVQPGKGMKGAFLPGLLIITQHKICQGPREPGAGGMDQHSRRLIHRQNMFIFI